jgi:hypothetical protein
MPRTVTLPTPRAKLASAEAGLDVRHLDSLAMAATSRFALVLSLALLTAVPAVADEAPGGPVCPPQPAAPPPAITDPERPPAGALIACIGNAPITGARFGHWYEAARRSVDVGLSFDDPFDQTMQFLVSADWILGEAADRGIHVSATAVRRRYIRDKRASFGRDEKAFKRYLRRSGLTVADIEYRERLDIVSNRVRRQVLGRRHISAKARRRRLDRFVRGFRRTWRARTACLPQYEIDDCGATLVFPPLAIDAPPPADSTTDQPAP